MAGLGVLLVAAVAIPLAGAAVAVRRAPSVGGAVMGLALAALFATVIWYVMGRRRWRTDDQVARYLGGSDLLSSVQLEHADRSTFSPDMIQALADHTARRMEQLDVSVAVPGQRLRRAWITLGACGFAAALGAAIAPDALATGWQRVLHGDVAGQFAGARKSDVPVVGDIRITLEYPGYSGRSSITLPASAGDFRTLAGTTVSIETRALTPTVEAKLIFNDDQDDIVSLAVDGERLTATFIVKAEATYRFYVEPESGAPLVEAVPHAIEIEPDELPVVELYAPADELDVEGRKRIELAYTTEDDFGIAEIALIWEGGAGTKPGRRVLLQGQEGRRTAQGRFLWDLAEVDLRPGSRVGYHIEVTDNDDVLGPNVGRSKTFYLRVFSKRERREEMIDRQVELFEKMAHLLGGRLTVPVDDLPTHESLNKQTRAVVVDLGGILAVIKQDELSGKDLTVALGEMHDRLRKLERAERKLLASAKPLPKLPASDKKHVAELEDDVLLLADWVDRQRLENVLALMDEIADRRKRLEALLEEYQRTGDPKLLEEIKRELRALEQALAELAQKQGRLSAEVLDRFMNMEALDHQKAKNCLAEVRKLLDAGDAQAAAAKLAECNQSFTDDMDDVEKALAKLRQEKFAESERKLDELRLEMADLAEAENETAARADKIMERYKERAADLLEDKAKDARSKTRKLIKQLRKRLDKVPKSGLTPFSKEELPVAKERLDDVEKMLDDGDLAEALEMARQAQNNLEAIEAELGADLDTGEPWNDRTGAAYNEIARAVPKARELVEELEKATPSPKQIMSKDDRRALKQLRRRQRAIRRRTQKLAEKAAGMSQELPGTAGDAIALGLGEATGHMERAEERMKQSDPPGARHHAREAADALERAQQQAKQQSRPGGQGGGRGMRDEPVRIPGADEYRAPEEFREEILEAMKKDKPSDFAEQIQRYYEELIK